MRIEEDLCEKPPHPENPDSRRSAFLAYNAALTALSPALLAWYGYRVFGNGKSREGWLERLGWPSKAQREIVPRDNVWLHAVSVGEVTVAASILREYAALSGAYSTELTTTTSTGRVMAHKLLPHLPVFYLPVDMLPAVRSVMKRVQPLCLALCEKELWPNLINEARRCGAAVAVVNGQVSDSTVEKARRFGSIYRWALGNVDRFVMQYEVDAQRIVEMGAPEERVAVAGNTKFDEAGEPLTPDEALELSRACGVDPADALVVAGSTNPGEEGVVLRAFQAARKRTAGLRLVIAPRQIERADEVVEECRGYGYSAIRRSAVTGGHTADVIVLDTFGELARIYRLANVAFVGGTFIDKGGHNILQPLAQGVPVTFGPYDYKIRDIAARALEAGVAYQAQTPEDLAKLITELATGERRQSLYDKALALIQSNQGASKRCAEEIQKLAERAKGSM
ncbi:MAG: hypothetical protein IT209_04040 [Armatimonadetes bacterium]|nr:hypothetical protein [Armatimonadota bacterium]